MKNNQWIAFSRHVYARLLYCYPSAHRAEYGDAMLQLFQDQCRAAYNGRGLLGMVALWLRTFFDLGSSAVSEHLAVPGVKLGLLDAVPNQPVPWKGVALVLIPGLILFASQIVQLTSDDLWFYRVMIWAPWLLMIPVTLTWLLTRRYPVWGLIPLGLLCSTAVDVFRNLVIRISVDLSNTQPYPFLQSIYNQVVYKGGFLWLTAGFVLFIGLVLWNQHRQQPFSRAAWGWLAGFLVLVVAQIYLSVQNPYGLGNSVPVSQILSWQGAVLAPTYKRMIVQHIQFWTIFSTGIFLVLILAGRVLARRHGDLAILFPLGYLLGNVVYGLYMGGIDDVVLYLIFGVVLVYRAAIALIAPIWISRSAGSARNWALAVPIVLAFAGRMLLSQVVMGYFYDESWLLRLSLLVDPFVTVAGLALAIVLYRQATPIAAQNLEPFYAVAAQD